MKTKVLIVIALCCSGAFAQDVGDFDRGAKTSTVFSADNATIVEAMAACGPEKTQFDVTHRDKSQPAAVPETGKALVYIIQEMPLNCGLFSCGTTTKAGFDGAWMGANHGSSYFSSPVAPGEHHLCVQLQSRVFHGSRSVALAVLTTEAGKTYYLRTRFIATELGGYMDLDPVNPDQGRLLVGSFPLSISHEKQ